jgi:hypothetical protein
MKEIPDAYKDAVKHIKDDAKKQDKRRKKPHEIKAPKCKSTFFKPKKPKETSK